MNTQCKIDCCFADNIYKSYQNRRYGINHCLDPEKEEIEKLADLKEIHDFNLKTDTLTDLCCMTEILEKINRI